MTQKLIYLTLILAAFTMGSCKKGCTDSNATNYDPDAKSDPGDVCTYEASMLVWFSQETADTLSATYPLDIWMGGNSVATWQQTDALTSEPGSCGSGTGIAIISKSGMDQVYTSGIHIWDANNIEVGSWTSEAFNGGECKKVKF